ncbi:hypothetical protein B0H17DRAFT_1203514 [Mycena rosella]|uniref:Uncharacterized protein n=1 Tax=Mycena rosella TaxID=1033263 RepID=A0AAD7DBV8_MYCRO|nr:hypothetical protein B0H17DRAFT_1203514 [Mycena rosella]
MVSFRALLVIVATIAVSSVAALPTTLDSLTPQSADDTARFHAQAVANPPGSISGDPALRPAVLQKSESERVDLGTPTPYPLPRPCVSPLRHRPLTDTESSALMSRMRLLSLLLPILRYNFPSPSPRPRPISSYPGLPMPFPRFGPASRCEAGTVSRIDNSSVPPLTRTFPGSLCTSCASRPRPPSCCPSFARPPPSFIPPHRLLFRPHLPTIATDFTAPNPVVLEVGAPPRTHVCEARNRMSVSSLDWIFVLLDGTVGAMSWMWGVISWVRGRARAFGGRGRRWARWARAAMGAATLESSVCPSGTLAGPEIRCRLSDCTDEGPAREAQAPSRLLPSLSSARAYRVRSRTLRSAPHSPHLPISISILILLSPA